MPISEKQKQRILTELCGYKDVLVPLIPEFAQSKTIYVYVPVPIGNTVVGVRFNVAAHRYDVVRLFLEGGDGDSTDVVFIALPDDFCTD